jgi:hypothetical protein
MIEMKQSEIIVTSVLVFLLVLSLANARTITGTFLNNVTSVNPTWSNNFTFPISATYSKNGIYSFQIDWDSLTHDFANSTFMSNYSMSFSNYTKLTTPSVQNISQTYWINITDVSAGTVGYKWFGQTAAGNQNSTGLVYYVISKKPTTTNVYINGSGSSQYYEYGTVLGVSGLVNSEYPVNVCLSLNDTSFGDCFSYNSGIIDTSNLTLGGNTTYNLTASFDGDQNHTASSDTAYLYVADTVAPTFNSFSKNETYINFNQSVGMLVNVTDVKVGMVLVELTLPNSSSFNYTMIKLDNGNWSKNFTKTDLGDLQSDIGRVTITRIFANDTSNNIITQSINDYFDYATTKLLIAESPNPVGNSTDSITISAAYTANDTYFTQLTGNCSVYFGGNKTYLMAYDSGLNRVVISMVGWQTQFYTFFVNCVNDSYQNQSASSGFSVISPSNAPISGGYFVPYEILKGGLMNETHTAHNGDTYVVRLNTTIGVNKTRVDLYTITINYVDAFSQKVKITIGNDSFIIVGINNTYIFSVNNGAPDLKITVLNFNSSATILWQRVTPAFLSCGNGVCEEDETTISCPIDCSFQFTHTPSKVTLNMLSGQVGNGLITVTNPSSDTIVIRADIYGEDGSQNWAFFGSPGISKIMYILSPNSSQGIEFQVVPTNGTTGKWNFDIRLTQEQKGGINVPVEININQQSGQMFWLMAVLNEDHTIPIPRYFYLPPIFQGNYILFKWMWVVEIISALIIIGILWAVLSFLYKRARRPRYITERLT